MTTTNVPAFFFAVTAILRALLDKGIETGDIEMVDNDMCEIGFNGKGGWVLAVSMGAEEDIDLVLSVCLRNPGDQTFEFSMPVYDSHVEFEARVHNEMLELIASI